MSDIQFSEWSVRLAYNGSLSKNPFLKNFE